VGCFPIIILFMLGAGIGYWVDGAAGSLWGAGLGLALGALAGVALAAHLKRVRGGD
jgi:hypothetical protein